MQKIHAAFLLTEILFLLAWLPLGEFRPEDYWPENYTDNLVNYVAEVGTDVVIMSPIIPAPIGLRWFSLNMDGELPHGDEDKANVTSSYSRKFQKTYNTSWKNVFKYDEFNRWLRIVNVRLGYADVFRVFMGESRRESINKAEVQKNFGVAITLMTYEQHECGFASMPQNPMKGDTLILSCSAIVNGPWNTSFIFHNYIDGSEIRGEVSECGHQPRIGSKICSTVKVKTKRNVFVYSCRLEFPSNERQDPRNPLFRNSKWTAEFNKKVVCYFPKIYLKSIPSNVEFLCNSMPCGDTALVHDTVTCEAHGYPKPAFDFRIQHLSIGQENKSKNQDFEVDYENPFIMDTADEEKAGGPSHMQASSHHGIHTNTRKVTAEKFTVSEDYWIMEKDVGRVEITCNASNALGWEYNALVLEVKLKHDSEAATETALNDAEADGNFLYHFGDMTIFCNSRICRNDEIMKFGDRISCYYDAKGQKVRMNFIMKINHYEKFVKKPCVYRLKMEDVGKKLVECIGYTEAGVSVVDVNIIVVCVFRYPHGHPHHTEDYDYVAENTKVGKGSEVVILCNDSPCDSPGRLIYTGIYLTCRHRDHRAANLSLNVNGEVGPKKPNDTTDPFFMLSNYGFISVKCFGWNGSSNYEVAALNLTVRYWPCGEIHSHETAHAAAAAGYLDFDSINDVPQFPIEAEPSIQDIGSCGQESFVFLQLLLVLIGVIVGQVRF